jgi:dihydroorotase
MENKESACGCAGIFTAHAAIELYAEAFAAVDALDRLEGFASFHGPDFYRLPRNSESLTLQRTDWQVPQVYRFGASQVRPLRSGETVSWKVADL